MTTSVAPASSRAWARRAKTSLDDSLALVRAVYLSQTLGALVRFADVLDGTHDDVVVATGPGEPG